MEVNIRKTIKTAASQSILPPIGVNKNDKLKTILDIDPQYYSLIEGRPIKSNKSIYKYKENIRDVVLKRILNGLTTDEVLRINREIKTERELYEMASDNFDEYKNSFDNFLAYDNDKTIVIMKRSDNIAKELHNKIEEHKKISFELASIKSKVQYISETLQILLSFQNFLYNVAPVLWQQNNSFMYECSEIINLDSDIYRKVDINLLRNKLNNLAPQMLYFETPDQLPYIFSLLEQQNLNYLLITEEINSEKMKFFNSRDVLKNDFNDHIEYIEKQIKEIQDVIVLNELQENDLKSKFYKILQENIRYITSSEEALKIFTYVEFTYEHLIARNDANLNSFDMTYALEKEYNELMLDLSRFDTHTISTIEKELYEKATRLTKQASTANKILKDVNKLNRRLQSSFKPLTHKK